MRGHKQDRILRILLTESNTLSKNELSKKAECTRQWVILFLRKLEKKHLIKGTKVIDKINLLQYWLSIYKKPKKFREYFIQEPLEILNKTNLEYAITTYYAENILQKFLFPSRLDAYIKEKDLENWHKLLTSKGLYGKGNFRIIITDEHVIYGKRKINNRFIVCLPQLIIDLFKEGGPCEEAAEMLLKKL
ncbi:hypothetical protein HZB00_03870 [Candidatus Woesearchaeota archaeon]|nr:hypothetical protein [Candidatus Woesearchaeota archaeon]